MLLIRIVASMYDLYLVEWALQIYFCGCSGHQHLLVAIYRHVSQEVLGQFLSFALFLKSFIHEHFLLIIFLLEDIFFNEQFLQLLHGQLVC